MTSNKANKKKNNNIIPIRDLIFHCLKNWYWFALSLSIALGVAVYIIKSTPPMYVRYAEILIKENEQGGSGGTGSTFKELSNSRTTADAQNEIAALQSVEIMKEAIRRLGLEIEFKSEGRFYNGIIYKDRPLNIKVLDLGERETATFTAVITSDTTVTLKEFSYDGESLDGEAITASIGDTIQTPVGRIAVEQRIPGDGFKGENMYITKHNIDMLANSFCSNLKVGLAKEKTSVISLSIKDVSTFRATNILTAILEVYNEKWVDENNYATVKTADFIGRRAEDIKQELEAIDKDIAKFRGDNKLSSGTASTLVKEAVSSKEQEQLLALNNQLELANFIKSYMAQSGTTEIIPSNTGIAATNVESLIGSYNTKVLERNRLVANSSENHPVVKDYDKDIEAMYTGIQTAIESHIKEIERQIVEANKEVESTISRITTTTHNTKELQTLLRQQKVKNALYLFLLQKLEETELSKEFSASNHRILVHPTGSNTPVEPMKRPIIMLALTIGVLVPVIVIFLLVVTNKKVRGRRDLEDINIPFIGEIPLYKERKKALGKNAKRIIVKGGSRNIINEAFRVMRTNFEFMVDKSKTSHVIITTSFNPGSGKTFLTMNLGTTLAIKGSKVLIIDGDLRRASASEYVQSTSGGLVEYLSGGTGDIDKIITTNTGYENLHIITVGTPPPNPTELLNSQRFEALIAEIRKRYDYIFIDCPPVEIVADTQIIEKYCDRTLFVIRAGLLNREMLEELQDIYDNKRFKGLAMILNGTHSGTGRYGYSYGYSYSYGYGYGYGYHYHSKK